MIFELVFLSSKTSSDDVVVGWGAFPIVNGDFQLNTGKFKVPLVHGAVDYDVDAFKCIESKYKRNLDEWLCNLYVDIRPIILNDFKEYESQITFTTKKKKQKKTLRDKAKRILFGLAKGKKRRDSDSSDSAPSSDENLDFEDDVSKDSHDCDNNL